VTSAVLDTNVLASGFTHRGGIPDQLLRRWLAGRYDLVVSQHILSELGSVFNRPYFSRRLTEGRAADNLALLRRRATTTAITVEVHGVATHPEDDLVLAAALSARADYLVTGDAQLQRIGTHEGVVILSPRGFLEFS